MKLILGNGIWFFGQLAMKLGRIKVRAMEHRRIFVVGVTDEIQDCLTLRGSDVPMHLQKKK